MDWKKVKVDDELTQGFFWFCFFGKLQYCNGFLVTMIFYSSKEFGRYSQLYLSAKLTNYF